MYTEYYFDVDWEAECENDSDTRSNLLPQPYTNAERDRNMAGIYRVIVLSTVLICDLQFGLNPLTALATVASIPLIIHLRD